MSAVLGLFGLAVGTFAGLLAAVLWARAARGRADGGLAAHACWLMLGGAVLAVVGLEYALVTDDMSVAFVADNSSRETPLPYRVTALWSGLGGSLVLWLLVMSAYAAVLSRAACRRPDPVTGPAGTCQDGNGLHEWAAAAVCAVTTAFFVVTLAGAQPFQRRLPAPSDGAGPNPLLADHPAMAVHPPLLYLGYVGLVVPFGYAVAALLTGRAGREWLAVTRTWVLVAWACLTAGIVLGAWWSYAVLGWGGYWAWDPVENASIVPWLACTALLHSAMVQRRRRSLATWNVSLAAASFVLVVVGTFLTRSGVVASVHAFTQSALGPLLLALVAVLLAAVLGLLLWRGGSLRDDDAGPAPLLSRETALVVNNAVLTGLATVILLGTVLPVLTNALSQEQVSVGPPYYDRLAVPAALTLLVLMVLGPLATWRGDSARALARRAAVPSATALVAAAAALAAGSRDPRVVAVTGLGAAVAEVALAALVRELRHDALRSLVHRRPALGGHVAHAAFALGLVAVAVSSTASVSTEGTVGLGGRLTVGGATATLVRVDRAQHHDRMATAARLVVRRGAATVGTATPALVYFPARDMTVSRPAIESGVREDVYLTVLAVAQDGRSATVRLAVDPMVRWLWVAGALLVLGAVVAVAGRGRPRRPAGIPLPTQRPQGSDELAGRVT